MPSEEQKQLNKFLKSKYKEFHALCKKYGYKEAKKRFNDGINKNQ